MYVPFHKISHDSTFLVHIFQFLGMAAPLPLTGIHGLIQNTNCSRIIKYMKKRIEVTLSILLITLMFAVAFTTLFNIIIKKDAMFTLGMILIGMLGGTYQSHLPIEQT